MENRDLYSIIAGILPPLLGLGLIELYVVREVSIGTIIAGIIALAALMIVISTLIDTTQAAAERPRRRRPPASRG